MLKNYSILISRITRQRYGYMMPLHWVLGRLIDRHRERLPWQSHGFRCGGGVPGFSYGDAAGNHPKQ